jgi:hypothetical protein
MKRLAFAALGALILGFSACEPNEPTPDPTPIPKTELQIIAVDSTGTTYVPSARVEVYKNQTDYASRNQDKLIQGIKYTDTYGRVTISSLEAIQYWFYVEAPDGMRNNNNDVNNATLVSGKLTAKKVTLKK